MNKVIGVDKIVDRDEFELRPGDHQFHKRSSDATEAVNGNCRNRHLLTPDTSHNEISIFERQLRLQGRTVPPDCSDGMRRLSLQEPYGRIVRVQ